MVCLSSYPPRAATLLRRGSRMAGRLNTDWFVVYVETPGEAPDRIDAEAQRHLLDEHRAARELGAEVVRLQGERPGDRAPRLRALARRRAHHHRPLAPAVVAAAARAVASSLRLVREATGLDVHIVSLEEEARA